MQRNFGLEKVLHHVDKMKSISIWFLFIMLRLKNENTEKGMRDWFVICCTLCESDFDALPYCLDNFIHEHFLSNVSSRCLEHQTNLFCPQ